MEAFNSKPLDINGHVSNNVNLTVASLQCGKEDGYDTNPSSSSCDMQAALNSSRRTSRVWKYFRIIDGCHYVCCLCQFVGAYTNTTNMRKHIQNHHPEIYQDILNHTRPSRRVNYLRPFSSQLLQSLPAFGAQDLLQLHASSEFSFVTPNQKESNDIRSDYKDQVSHLSKELCPNLRGSPYLLSGSQPSFSSVACDNSINVTTSHNLEPSNCICPEDLKSSTYNIVKSESDIYLQDFQLVGGEDRKMDLSSLVAGNMNENSMGSVGDNPGTSNDCPIPSPEQYLTEEMDQQPTPSNIQVQRPESYKLRHNNHLSLVLESLAGDESFMDVTLTAQGKAIKAHKSVLSAVSPYFKSVLKENPCQHPIIIMPRDIRFGELNNIISYVYKGEMTVAAEDLPSLLRTAEILQVTGLTPSDSSAMSGTSSSILGQIRGATAAAAANSNMSTSCSSPSPSPAKTVNKKSARYHSTPKLKEVPQSSSYDNEMSDKIDPLDYLNPDMACVKEELSSDDEKNYEASTETAEDVQFPTQIPQDLPVDSSYNSKKGCPLSKKRKASTETSSLHDDPDEDAGNHSDSLTDECLINQTALFVCPYCFESHRPTEVLQTHLRLKHPSKPSFLCKCGKVFVRQALFEQHKKSCDKL